MSSYVDSRLRDIVAPLVPMADYPELKYSMKAVRRAGERLAKDIAWDNAQRDEILETFTIANSWRNSHVYPMRSVVLSVRQRMRHACISGFTAARPKRMNSIRKKLRRLSVQLEQINDLGGCRAVVDDIECVKALIEECRRRLPHKLRQEWDYIAAPKTDGYRSHHMVFQYQGRGKAEIFSGRRIELQIRTRLQHSWATAVEAVGLYRGEDLKAGEGHPDWLRLFQLMSLEFAVAENCAPDGDEVGRRARQEEIRKLNEHLRAAGMLEDLKAATRYLDDYVHEPSRFYLIRYEQKAGDGPAMVEVKPYFSALESTATLGALEQEIEAQNTEHKKVVLVEVEKVEGLIEAYPNYFGDVSLFVSNLNAVCSGRAAIEYSMAPPSLVAPRPETIIDPAWLKPRRHRRWTEEVRKAPRN